MKTILKLASVVSLLTVSLTAFATPTPVNIGGWQSDGDGNWVFAPDNLSAQQNTNGFATVLYEQGTNAQGGVLSGQIDVNTTIDDDFIGFVLGYQSGEIGTDGKVASVADFILIDWKQADQALGSGIGYAGIAASRVEGGASNFDIWTHTGEVSELARGINFGSLGWLDNTSYQFDLVFTDSLIQVYINNTLEIDLTGSFSDGSFGFYNFSQPSVEYSQLRSQTVEEFFAVRNVNQPNALILMFAGFLLLIRKRFIKSK